MKFISVWNEKGGVGKSTLAYNLAGAATLKGYHVLLVDEDAPQHSSHALSLDGHAGFTVVPTRPDEKPNADFSKIDLVIIDMSPGVKVLPRGNIVIPYQPNRLAFQATAKHFAKLQEIGSVVRVMSMVNSRLKSHRDFANEQRSLGAKQISYWSCYERATNEGRTIFDPALNHLGNINKARNEINIIFDEVMSHD